MAVKDELSKSMSSFGYQIIQTLVTDIEPDHKVREAMNEINSAQRFRYHHRKFIFRPEKRSFGLKNKQPV